jgi:hypothetical protein
VGGPGGLDTEQVNEAIEKYLDDNPYTINDAPPDENKNFELNPLTDVELAELSARIT